MCHKSIPAERRLRLSKEENCSCTEGQEAQVPRTVVFCRICYPAFLFAFGEIQACLQLRIGKSCLLVCWLGLYLILPVKLVNMKHIQGRSCYCMSIAKAKFWICLYLYRQMFNCTSCHRFESLPNLTPMGGGSEFGQFAELRRV